MSPAPRRGKPDRTKPAAPGDQTERLMMESLADPSHRKLTITERCELLGISRRLWYLRLEDPLFKARAARVYRTLCDDRLAPVLDALTESAMLLGKDGHADRKLFLELLGEYAPGQPREEAAKPGERMTDDELLAAFEGRMHLLPPGVLRRLGRDPDAHTDKAAA